MASGTVPPWSPAMLIVSACKIRTASTKIGCMEFMTVLYDGIFSSLFLEISFSKLIPLSDFYWLYVTERYERDFV